MAHVGVPVTRALWCQTLADVTAVRAVNGTEYLNGRDYPLLVSVCFGYNVASSRGLVGWIGVSSGALSAVSREVISFASLSPTNVLSFVVPSGWYYAVTERVVDATLSRQWWEVSD